VFKIKDRGDKTRVARPGKSQPETKTRVGVGGCLLLYINLGCGSAFWLTHCSCIYVSCPRISHWVLSPTHFLLTVCFLSLFPITQAPICTVRRHVQALYTDYPRPHSHIKKSPDPIGFDVLCSYALSRWIRGLDGLIHL
jgi:hypothetical protein